MAKRKRVKEEYSSLQHDNSDALKKSHRPASAKKVKKKHTFSHGNVQPARSNDNSSRQAKPEEHSLAVHNATNLQPLKTGNRGKPPMQVQDQAIPAVCRPSHALPGQVDQKKVELGPEPGSDLLPERKKFLPAAVPRDSAPAITPDESGKRSKRKQRRKRHCLVVSEEGKAKASRHHTDLAHTQPFIAVKPDDQDSNAAQVLKNGTATGVGENLSKCQRKRLRQKAQRDLSATRSSALPPAAIAESSVSACYANLRPTDMQRPDRELVEAPKQDRGGQSLLDREYTNLSRQPERKKRKPLRRNLVAEVTRTVLARKPTKACIESGTAAVKPGIPKETNDLCNDGQRRQSKHVSSTQSNGNARSFSTAAVPVKPAVEHALLARLGSIEHHQRSSARENIAVAGDDAALVRTSGTNASVSDTRGTRHHSMTSEQNQTARQWTSSVAVPTNESRFRVPKASISINPFYTRRRPIVIGKANSVPSYGVSKDAKNSFKTFSAYLAGKDEYDSETSESDGSGASTDDQDSITKDGKFDTTQVSSDHETQRSGSSSSLAHSAGLAHSQDEQRLYDPVEEQILRESQEAFDRSLGIFRAADTEASQRRTSARYRLLVRQHGRDRESEHLSNSSEDSAENEDVASKKPKLTVQELRKSPRQAPSPASEGLLGSEKHAEHDSRGAPFLGGLHGGGLGTDYHEPLISNGTTAHPAPPKEPVTPPDHEEVMQPVFKASAIANESDHEVPSGTEDVFRTIDDVSFAVFNDTRALGFEIEDPTPTPSKPHLHPSQRPIVVDVQKVTGGPSVQLVTSVGSMSDKQPRFSVSGTQIRSGSPVVFICRSARIQQSLHLNTVRIPERVTSPGAVELLRRGTMPDMSGLQPAADPTPPKSAPQQRITSAAEPREVHKRRSTGARSKHFSISKTAERARKGTKSPDTDLARSADAEAPSPYTEELEVPPQRERARSATRSMKLKKRATNNRSQCLNSTMDTVRVDMDPVAVPATPKSQRSKGRRKHSTTRISDFDSASDDEVQERKVPHSKRRKQTGFKPDSNTSANETDAEASDLLSHEMDSRKSKKRRVPAGASSCPFPSITAPRFGLMQEKLCHDPFRMILGTIFLNKTAGKSAMPVFYQLMEEYPTVQSLAEADESDVFEMIKRLGLGRQRARRCIKIANDWLADPPVKGRRHRALHYPSQDDGREFGPREVLEGDVQDVAGAHELAHVTGTGPYAWDSWRIFCRDVLRGVSRDYNGKDASTDFEPEWKRVLPQDKELRACLRWMWLREGWAWDPLIGKKERASDETMAMAIEGQADIEDEGERKFAALHADETHGVAQSANPDQEEMVATTPYHRLKILQLKELLGRRGIPMTGLRKKQQMMDKLEEDDARAC